MILTNKIIKIFMKMVVGKFHKIKLQVRIINNYRPNQEINYHRILATLQ